MRRRALLTAGAAALAAAAGCLDQFDDGGDGNGGDGGDQTTDDPTTRDDDSGTLDPSEDAEHRLYVENLDDESHLADVEVTEADDGRVVVAGRYDVPDERGIEFPEVAAPNAVYEVTVALPEAGLSDTFEWDVGDCTDGEGAGGSRNGSVRISEGPDELTWVEDRCDEIVAGHEVSTGPADNFLVAGATEEEDVNDESGVSEDDCPPMLEVDRVGDEATTVPDESLTAYEDLPADRQAEFEEAVDADRIDLKSDYAFWVEDVEFVAYEGETYHVGVSVC